ncbi:hypothetical protein SAMN05443144_10777 [Fodinibius roseus]|uniref:Outer membrane receptor proteins, mostly Fe transport n=1 Tax=Fodinibius roseus TaxID=1194090 RepID=A0A1M5AI74_9BACT|nr:Plug domain-containing protein [Fodinibius roseus]SHF29978.1 hypothetical protein SAMN05443144_10777 [Fodinibius roseus]
MIRLLLSILVFLCCLPWQSTAQYSAEKRDSLNTSILINPNDLLHTIPEWDAVTTDGFTYRVNTGLYGFYGPQPTIYLDDIPIDFSFFNWQNLNMLPSSIEQISRISYSSEPRVYNQTLSRAGYLNLHTPRPDSGLSVYGSFTVGNQIEDPGPWSYDSSKVTPNIDRRGPHYFSGFAYRSSGWYARGQFSLRQHQPTNLNNHHRIGNYSYVDNVWHAVKTTVTNGLAEIGYQSDRWNIRARGLSSNNEEYVFFQPFGREVPSLTGYRQLAVQAARESGPWKVSGRYLAHRKFMDYRLNNKGYDFDWQQLSHHFSLSSRYRQHNMRFRSGASLEISDTRGLQMESQQVVATLFGSLHARLHARHTLDADLNVDIAARETAASFSLSSRHQLTDGWTVEGDIDYDELLYYRQQSSTYWYRHGYTLYSQLGIGIDTPISSQRNRAGSIQLTNRIRLAPSTSFHFKGQALHHYALNIPWQVVALHEQQFQGLYTQPQDLEFTSEEGNRFNLRLGLSQQLNSRLSHQFNVMMQYTLSGTNRYRSYWQQTPQNRMTYEFNIQPASDLSFSLLTAYRSSSQWKEYQNLDGKRYRSLQPQYPLQYGTFRTRTPSFLKVDITAKKWFWNQRLATTFSVRNLLNTEVRYHTLGLDKALQFVIKASLTL